MALVMNGRRQTVRNGLGLRDLRLVHETFINQLCGGIVPNLDLGLFQT
jgi:hypothetical protein